MSALPRLSSAVAAFIGAASLCPSQTLAQGVEVVPVNVQLAPGQLAAALTITNRNSQRISFQIRGYSWQQDSAGGESLLPSDVLMSSPPIATIQPEASQVVRLILRNPPEGREGTYRIILDQLPPPGQPGIVQVLLRLSIPVFAQPRAHIAPQVHWRVEREGGRWWLIASNSGSQHLSVRNMRLADADGRQLGIELKSPPHILAGGTRRWPIVAGSSLVPNEIVRLTASADVGTIDQRISADAGP